MTEALSSDLLERQFGPTEVDILFQDEGTRIIATKAVGDGRILEVSWVVFATDAAANFPEPYSDMQAGESMGKAFRAHDIKFERTIRSSYTADLPPAFQRWFNGTRESTVIDLSILAGPHKKLFADVLETYRPGVIWPYLTGEPTFDQQRRIGLLANFLDTVSKTS